MAKKPDSKAFGKKDDKKIVKKDDASKVIKIFINYISCS